MTLASISALPDHATPNADALLQLGQRLLDHGYARLHSLYFRRVHGQSQRIVTLTPADHSTGLLRLSGDGVAVTCHYVRADGRDDLVATATPAVVLSAVEDYLGLNATPRAA